MPPNSYRLPVLNKEEEKQRVESTNLYWNLVFDAFFLGFMLGSFTTFCIMKWALQWS